MTAPIGDANLQAYLDGQLDTGGRIEVERWLQDDPEAAAEVMAALGQRDEVRLFLADDNWPAAPATIGLARELQRRLGRRSIRLRIRRGLAAAALIGAGWWAHAELGLFVDQVAAAHPAPAFAEEAAAAWDAMRLKLTNGHPPEAGTMSLPARLTGQQVPLPMLGGGLRALGSELVPWNGGAALVVLYRSGADQVVSLFAAEAGSFAVAAPEAATLHGLTTVFWQVGPIAYALNGSLPEADLLAIARAAAPQPWAGFEFNLPTEGATDG